MAEHHLISIAFSHYNEKARWGLSRAGIPYRESRYMPLLHMPAVAWATRSRSDAGADRNSTRFSTPVLVTPAGERICDSSRILQYADHNSGAETLYPSEEVAELEEHFSRYLGPDTRRAAYQFVLADRQLLREIADANVGVAQARLFRAVAPLGVKVLRRALGVTAERAARSEERIATEFERVSERIAGRNFLVGDRFTAADLTFACMAAPALLVTREEGYDADMPDVTRLSPAAQEFCRRMRDTAAGQFALRMFREQRARS